MNDLSYSTQSPPLGGTIKQRYIDFVVEEIRPDGRICETTRFQNDDGLDRASAIAIPPRPEGIRDAQLHCDLEKINLDTPTAITHLAGFLRFSRKRIGYAGLKDKRGVTSQRISIFEPDIERLQKFESRRIDLRNFEWSNERIEIGELKGNRFTITIRNIELQKKEIEKRIQEFFREAEQNGVANFFGEQRFGGIRNNTHLVGKLLLKGQLEEAILLYLTKESEKESEELSKIRRDLRESKNYLAALRAFPKNYRFERAMCQHLHNFPNDFAGALQKLPKALRYLFSHAWQAHLWNELLEKRLKSGMGLARTKEDTFADENESNENLNENSNDDNQSNQNSNDEIPTLPIFGFETKLDSGKLGELEREVLQENDFSLTEFKCKQVPELSSSGGARKIAVKPENQKWIDISEDEFNPEKQKAKIRFELEKGTYATTVLRELTK